MSYECVFGAKRLKVEMAAVTFFLAKAKNTKQIHCVTTTHVVFSYFQSFPRQAEDTKEQYSCGWGEKAKVENATMKI